MHGVRGLNMRRSFSREIWSVLESLEVGSGLRLIVLGRVSTDQILSHSHCERTADARVRPLFSRLMCEVIKVGCRTSDMSYAEKRLVS